MSTDAKQLERPSPGKLEFFSNSSGFTINGGTFINRHGSSDLDLEPHLAHLEEKFSIDIDKLSNNDLYTLMMLPQRKGYPLWDPRLDNNLPEEYRGEGVRVGDVGSLNGDGGFDFLFNVCLPTDHPVNHGRVPDGFKPLECLIDKYHRKEFYPSGHSIHSSDPGIHRRMIPLPDEHQGQIRIPGVPDAMEGGIRFTSSIANGAILILPEGGSRTYAHNIADFLEYAKSHAIEWYRHVNGRLRRMVGNSSLYLVTGCDKARCWGSAAFKKCRPQDVSLTFVPRPARSGDTKRAPEYYFETYQCCTPSPHSGSNQDTSGNLQNGCVFMRGFKIAVKKSLLGTKTRLLSAMESPPEEILDRGSPFRLRGGASSDDSSDSDDHDSDTIDPINTLQVSIAKFTPEKCNPFHPSDILNEYVLHKTQDSEEVDVVITHDDQWLSMIDTLYEPSNMTPNLTNFVESFLSTFQLRVTPPFHSDHRICRGAHWEVQPSVDSSFHRWEPDALGPRTPLLAQSSSTLLNSSPIYNSDAARISPFPSGPQHRPVYTAKVYIDDVLYGIGTATSMGAAREAAAVEALRSISAGDTSYYKRSGMAARTTLNNWAQARGATVKYESKI